MENYMYLCFEVRSLLTLDVNLKLFWYKEQTCRLKKREKLDQQKNHHKITGDCCWSGSSSGGYVQYIDIHYISNFQVYTCIVIYSIRWYVRKK